MSPKQYDLYVKDCALHGITPFPNDMGTPPDVFGRYYVCSTKLRHNQIKRKQLAKQNRKH